MGSGLTFSQWSVLDGTRELIAETGDAVSQNQVCARVQLNRATVSFVMATLAQKSLVCRGIDYTGKAWRIYLTANAKRLLRALCPRIEAAVSSLSELAPQMVQYVDTGDEPGEML